MPLRALWIDDFALFSSCVYMKYCGIIKFGGLALSMFLNGQERQLQGHAAKDRSFVRRNGGSVNEKTIHTGRNVR